MMSPMMFLKCRAENCVDPDWNSVRKLLTPFSSYEAIGMNGGICHRISSENEAASLLLSMSNIVSDEIKNNACLFDDSSNNETLILKSRRVQLVPGGTTRCDNSVSQFTWNRVRTVSMDCSSVNSSVGHQGTQVSTTKSEKKPNRALRKAKGRLSDNGGRHRSKLPQMRPKSEKFTLKGQKKKNDHANVGRRKAFKKILRKKFSWKNYPELEAFLVANREEYLRHSALNYTIQQKQYNNRLTERMLELAAEHGYIFDESEFSFVTVRDRIRCYFKSYVQSAKKRGIIIGYAARKAGLFSTEELERSAERKGEIYSPEKYVL